MTAIEKEIQALKKDIQHIKQEGKKAMNGALNDKVSFLHPEHLRSMAYQAGKEVSAYMHNKGEQVKQVVNTCEGTIKKHPFTTTAAAFAVGAILAALLRRK